MAKKLKNVGAAPKSKSKSKASKEEGKFDLPHIMFGGNPGDIIEVDVWVGNKLVKQPHIVCREPLIGKEYTVYSALSSSSLNPINTRFHHHINYDKLFTELNPSLWTKIKQRFRNFKRCLRLNRKRRKLAKMLMHKGSQDKNKLSMAYKKLQEIKSRFGI